MSATVGLVLIVIAFYNLYAINYHKCKHLVWRIQEKVYIQPMLIANSYIRRWGLLPITSYSSLLTVIPPPIPTHTHIIHTDEPKPTDLAPSVSEPPGSFPEHPRTSPFGIGGKHKEEEEEEEELEATRVRGCGNEVVR